MDGVTAKQLLGQCDHCAVYPRQQGTLKICSRCRVAKYCSQECQRAAWKQHKKMCHPCNLNPEVSRIPVRCFVAVLCPPPSPGKNIVVGSGGYCSSSFGSPFTLSRALTPPFSFTDRGVVGARHSLQLSIAQGSGAKLTGLRGDTVMCRG